MSHRIPTEADGDRSRIFLYAFRSTRSHPIDQVAPGKVNRLRGIRQEDGEATSKDEGSSGTTTTAGAGSTPSATSCKSADFRFQQTVLYRPIRSEDWGTGPRQFQHQGASNRDDLIILPRTRLHPLVTVCIMDFVVPIVFPVYSPICTPLFRTISSAFVSKSHTRSCICFYDTMSDLGYCVAIGSRIGPSGPNQSAIGVRSPLDDLTAAELAPRASCQIFDMVSECCQSS